MIYTYDLFSFRPWIQFTLSVLIEENVKKKVAVTEKLYLPLP